MGSYFVWDVAPEMFRLPGTSHELRWYGLLFALGILVAYYILRSMVMAEKKSVEIFEVFPLYIIIATVLGARLGHIIFYNPSIYLADPLKAFRIWEGGLASHGGFFAVIVALIIFSKRHRGEYSFLWLADRCAIAGMFTAGCIRMGNFFNSEIVGNFTDVPWGVVFARLGEDTPRHPTQLYESFGYFYICLMFYLFYRYKNRLIGEGRLFGAVMIAGFGYRAFVEIFKENHNKEFVENLPFNTGQMLSIPFILVGLYFLLGWHKKFKGFRRTQ